MLRKEMLERFRGLEERIHWLGGLFACCFVLTVWGEHLRRTAEEGHGEWVERLDHVLITLDIVIAVLFIAGLLFKTFALKRSNAGLREILRDSGFSQSIRGWFSDAPLPSSELKVQFCDENCYDELVSLNFDAFHTSAFAVEKEKLEHRNRKWLHRNTRIFMLILDPLRAGRTIGYSAMLPLTDEGIESYLDGALKDADIPASLVAENRATASAVLIFAIYLKEEYSFTKAMASRNYTEYFLECVRYHLHALFDGTSGFPPIYMQTEGVAMERRVRRYGFADTGKKSADGFPLLVLERPFEKAASAAA